MTTPSLTPGARLGPYEIEAFLGAGGMGEVYRARDTRLPRTVAIKILLGSVPQNDHRRLRFQREAQAISSLNHPNIRTLYDVGTAGDIDFLVMEYIEGQPLTDELKEHPLPFERALKYAIELAQAVSVAHSNGIVHCDIKPANILVTPWGLKLLDFGIARLWNDWQSSDADSATTATESSDGEGTAAYMAPERFDGVPCDARGDVYALGVVFYQLFAGRKPFEAESREELLTLIRNSAPPSLSVLNQRVSSELEHVITKCLALDRARRWQSSADLASELAWTTERAPLEHSSSPVRSLLPAALMILAVAAVGAGLWSLRAETAAISNPVRFMVQAEPGSMMSVNPGAFQISPDGSSMVYTASIAGGKRVLWLRAMNEYDARPLLGTDDAWNPFWNPDSRRIGFFAGTRLRAVNIDTGTVVTIGDLPPGTRQGSIGSWSSTGQILLATNDSLLQMAESDGTLMPVSVHLDILPARYSAVDFLPDGHRFLFYLRSESPTESGLYVGDLNTSVSPRRLLESDSQGVYAEPGYILYLKGTTLFAQRVDPNSLEPTAPAVALPDDVASFRSFNHGAFSVSRSGALAYRTGVITSQLRWFDRTGRLISAAAPAGPYANPALSPDGTRVAVTRFDPAVGTSDVWTIDPRGGLAQLMSTPTVEDFPLWSPDGKRVLFAASPDGWGDLYVKPWSAAIGDPPEPVSVDRANKMPLQWNPGGSGLLFLSSEHDGFLNGGFFLKPLHQGQDALPTLEESRGRAEGQPQLSPDGEWVAYVTGVVGSPHVFVRSSRHEKERFLISPAGGFEPRWRGDGRELFYLAPDGALMATDVHIDVGAFAAGVPRPLFRTKLSGSYLGSAFPYNRVRNEYDVTADGQRFLLNEPTDGASPYAVRVVINWPALLPDPRQ